MKTMQTILFPGTVLLGAGAVDQLGQQALRLGGHHAFILTDPGVKGVGLCEPLVAALNAAGITSTIYDGATANPDIATVDAAAAAYRSAAADILVGLGGGSALDTAKAARLLLGSPAGASVAEFSSMIVDQPRPAPTVQAMPPMIAVPTTAGTGSEVTPWAVITNPAGHFKFGVGGDYLLPTVAVVDPALMTGLPPHLTAATGMDALTHLIEAYVSLNHQPLLDPLILRGIRLVGQWLRLAVAQGDNLQARTAMAEASLLGGIAISSNWLGACHSLAHQLSSFGGLHHGLSCGIMLPHQMAFSLPGALQRYADVGQALDPQRRPANSLRKRAKHAVRAVRQLLADINLPTDLLTAGLDPDLIPAMADSAYQNDLNHTTNPWPVTRDDLETLYKRAL